MPARSDFEQVTCVMVLSVLELEIEKNVMCHGDIGFATKNSERQLNVKKTW